MRISALLTFSLLMSLALSGGSNAKAEVSAQDQTLIRSAQAAIQLSHQQRRKLWDGFDFSTYPLILYKSQQTGDRGILFNYPNSQVPTGFHAVLGFANVYDTLSSQAYPAPFDIGYAIGDYQGVVVDQDFSLPVVIHETFHFYQASKAFFSENTSHNTYYAAEDVALAELEQEALANALQESSPKAKTQHIHRFLDLRKMRNALHPDEVTLNEDSLEAVEGTAAYVENRFSQFASEANIPSTTQDAYLSEALIKKQVLDDLRTPIDKDAMQRGRYYATGFVMAQLLAGYQMDWQKQAESGQTLVDLLQQASLYKGTKAGVLDAIRQQPEFLKRTAAQQAYLETLNREKERVLRDFESSKGSRITVRLPFAFGGLSISTRGSVSLAENRSIVDQYASVSKEDPDLSLLIKGPMLQDIEDTGHYLFVFYANPIDVLKVDGQSLISKTGEFRGILEMRVGETRLQTKKAHVVIDEKGVQIKLLK